MDSANIAENTIKFPVACRHARKSILSYNRAIFVFEV